MTCLSSTLRRLTNNDAVQLHENHFGANLTVTDNGVANLLRNDTNSKLSCTGNTDLIGGRNTATDGKFGRCGTL